MNDQKSNVKVVCRFRPLNQIELKYSEESSCSLNENTVKIVSKKPKMFEGTDEFFYTFDALFDWNSSQKEVFKEVASQILEALFEGINGTILAYGQTGSGKTFTMQGYQNMDGIIPRTINKIFETIENSDDHLEFTVKVSIIEIYKEEIKDLLVTKNNRDKLIIREEKSTGVFIQGLTSYSISTREEFISLISKANKQRKTAGTQMNKTSSRSHLITTIYITQSNTIDNSVW